MCVRMRGEGERGREGGRKGGREREREGGREGEGGREREREIYILAHNNIMPYR